MRIASRAAAPILLVLTVAMAACGGDDSDAVERAIEQAGGGDVDIEVDDDSGEFRVASDDGSFAVSSSSELPDEWPADIGLPDGFQITGTSSVSDGGSGSLVGVSGTVTMTLDELDRFYADTLSGWTEAMRTTSGTGEGAHFNATYQQGGRSLAVGGLGGGDAIEVTLSYIEDPAQSDGSAEPVAPNVDIDAGGLGIDGVDEALDMVGTDAIASALVSALKAERYEIVGDVVHLYLTDTGTSDAMMACIVANAVVSDTAVVVHDASGTETAC